MPQTTGVINVSHFYIWPEVHQPYSVKLAYDALCDVLCQFFARFGLDANVHATPFSFCDGDYNINIAGKKIVGTAQRVLSVRQGKKLVLAQACILINDDMDRLVAPVNLINRLHGYPENIRADVHTCLAEHVASVPDTHRLFSALTQAFIDYQRPVPNSA